MSCKRLHFQTIINMQILYLSYLWLRITLIEIYWNNEIYNDLFLPLSLSHPLYGSMLDISVLILYFLELLIGPFCHVGFLLTHCLVVQQLYSLTFKGHKESVDIIFDVDQASVTWRVSLCRLACSNTANDPTSDSSISLQISWCLLTHVIVWVFVLTYRHDCSKTFLTA